MKDKELALFKITGNPGKKIEDCSASCGECNKSYPGDQLIANEDNIKSNRFHYRLTYLCPKGHIVLGADV